MLSLQALAQGTFLFVVITLLLSWLVPKIYTMLMNALKTVAPEKPNSDNFQVYESHQKECRDNCQKNYDTKVTEYKERILVPRNEEKLRKKEEDFVKFLGPSWKGKGSLLGGENYNDGIEDLEDAQRAANRRIVREDINAHILSAAVASVTQRQKIKRIITLPDEPNTEEPGAISILFRTPLGTTFQRRFCSSDSVQCLLDLITTKGFSDKTYTISTSYPRLLLSDPGLRLSEHNFGKRIVLNIEEKDI